jgi:methyl-accepting chemotaxis protein
MLNRLSVNTILKSVFAVLLAVIVCELAASAWDSWRRVATVSRIAAVADVTSHLFTALHNLRVDRAATARDLIAEQPVAVMTQQLKEVRAADLPALKSAFAALERVDFPEQKSAIVDLAQRVKKLEAMHEESVTAFGQPKAARRVGLAKEYFEETSALIDTLDALSARLTRLIKLDDAYVDQLMEIKQLGWVARNAGGDASVMISNGIGGLPLPAEPMLKYTANAAKLDVTWASLEQVASGLPMPARFTAALDKAKREFFANDFIALRDRTMKTLIAGQKSEMTVEQWTGLTVPKLALLLNVAEVALDAAKEHAATQRAAAVWRLTWELALLALVLAFGCGMIVLITRRITRPLDAIQRGMRRLARGDMSVAVSYTERKDEIGALAGAMQAFKDSLIEADRLRTEQKASEGRAVEQRKRDMSRLADEFQTTVGNIVGAVSGASIELEQAARTLTRTAESTQQLSGMVASSSEEASGNVQSVASATEEMTSSVGEIARQVQESSRIANEAVTQAEKTDARINALSGAASRIGDVVKLITAIAEQTNLLALNATIEAARAGEAGRGFAVVAQEVKALAAQTAKATDEIGTQIGAMQAATQESVAAIKEISGTIARIAGIAATIAAAVEEQGAATQEIARNVGQAAKGTAEVVENISDVNRGASETGEASTRVFSSAQALARESGSLRQEVEKFVAMVRAA